MEFIIFPSTQIAPTHVHRFQDVKVLRPSQLRFAAEAESRERGKAYAAAGGIDERNINEEGVARAEHQDNSTNSNNNDDNSPPDRFNPYYPVPPEHLGLLSGGRLRQLCLSQLSDSELHLSRAIYPERLHLVCVQPPLPPLYGYDVWTSTSSPSTTFSPLSSSSPPSSPLFPSVSSSSLGFPSPFPSRNVPITRPQPCVLKVLAAEEVAVHYFHISELLNPDQLFIFTCWDNLESFAEAYQMMCASASVVFPLPCISFPTLSSSSSGPSLHVDDTRERIRQSEDDENEDRNLTGMEEEDRKRRQRGEEEEGEGSRLLYHHNCEDGENGEEGEKGSAAEGNESHFPLSAKAEEGESDERKDVGGGDEEQTLVVGVGGANGDIVECRKAEKNVVQDGVEGDSASMGEQEQEEGRGGTSSSLVSPVTGTEPLGDGTAARGVHHHDSDHHNNSSNNTSSSTSPSPSSSMGTSEFPDYPLSSNITAGGGSGILRGGKRGREDGSVSTTRISPAPSSRNIHSVFPFYRRGRDELSFDTVSTTVRVADVEVLNALLDEEVEHIQELKDEYEEYECDGEEEEDGDASDMDLDGTGKDWMEPNRNRKSLSQKMARDDDNAVREECEGRNTRRRRRKKNKGSLSSRSSQKRSAIIPLLSSPYWGRIIAPYLCQSCHHFPLHTYTMTCCGAVICKQCGMTKKEEVGEEEENKKKKREGYSPPPFPPSSEAWNSSSCGGVGLCPVCEEEPLSPPQRHPERDKRQQQLIKELKVLYFPHFQQQPLPQQHHQQAHQPQQRLGKGGGGRGAPGIGGGILRD